MKVIKVTQHIFFAFLINVIIAFGAKAATITAADCSSSAVQTAVNSASDGDTVLIPNGSCTWTTGISTTKQIWIRAQNYTAVSGGSGSRNVTITNNSSSPLFNLTSGNSYHVRISGIRFNEGSGMVNAVRFQGTGSKVPLLDDCYFQVKERQNVNEPDGAVLALLSQGGVAWNCYLSGAGFGASTVDGVAPDGASVIVQSPRAWTTASTMGALDTNGNINWYLEDSTFFNFGQFPDVDNNGRIVIRHSTIDGASGVTHGFTSAWGGRFAEYYNDTFNVTTNGRDIAGRYFWVRGGTALFTDNVVYRPNTGYGAPVLLAIGDNTSPSGSYLIPRQPGCGHNGTSYVSDPIYIWNNTGAGAQSWGYQDQPGGWESYVVLNRDVFVSGVPGNPKPGYTKYTYPHPLRSGGSADSPLGSPANLKLQ
jgi:hypothetical protein